MENENVFRLSEKFYKKQPDSGIDLSKVLDASDENSFGFEKLQETKPGVWEHEEMPGLLILNKCLAPETQLDIVKCILERQLSDSRNKSNLSPFYELPHGEKNLWTMYKNGEDNVAIPPTGSSKPVTVKNLMEKKLRWITFGEQYNWTTRVYPDPATAPPFPEKLGHLTEELVHKATEFKDWKAEAAIVNFYSPRDTLSGHVDDAEDDLTLPLLSMSIGLDCIYLLGTETRKDVPKAIRLHSGDAVIMTGLSRKAYHAVPKIIPNTAPSYLQLKDEAVWNQWIQTKRVNFNIRQVRV
ncbi:alkB protein [Schizosaccharomyces japonicus yFS275]|uniref:AlkB protein n=1 Tax=Schizosaccharomyces japonicus (strain yFS275 / FY16936) TaxID=402676 RepID=B6JWW7_SCHJY|nr:alkB protein [Schizosaccharomyces japonicus yFS275]EEB05868.1 alkB protein [Schizosaccharomyces japonicus yFS275]